MAVLIAQSLPPSKLVRAVEETTAAAGSTVKELTIDCDSVLVAVYVMSIDPGVTLDVVVDTVGGADDRTLRVLTFPQLSAASTEMLIQRPTVALDRVRITATYTGAVSYEIRVKALTAGELSARILGVTEASASKIVVGVVPQVVIPASLSPRSGMAITNHNTSGTLYIGFSAAQAVTGTGWPLGPNGALAVDLDAGVALWGVGTEPIDTRILQGGG